MLEVRVVDVCIHTEQPLEDAFDHAPEICREGLSIVLGKYLRVIHLSPNKY